MRDAIINVILNAIEARRSQATRALSVALVKDGSAGVLVTVRGSGIGLGRLASAVRTFPISIPAASGPVS